MGSQNRSRRSVDLSVLLLLAAGAACSNGAAAPASVSGLHIVAASGSPLAAQAGDGLQLKVVQTDADGEATDLPAGAKVAWTLPATITALAPDDDPDPTPLPRFGEDPTALFIDNPGRTDRSADLVGTVFVLDPGTALDASLQVSAAVTGVAVSDPTGPSASVAVAPGPIGDQTRGSALYGSLGANCAECHGPTGHGSTEPASSSSFVIAGRSYDFPAPGLNAEDGNVGSDPDWNAALLAIASRSDVDNDGITLRLPMPDWLSRPNPATGLPLTTQDFADIYAFLQTQTQ